ncbi:hypothetical protein FRB97_001380 [Tulasnella sp. 331]|nr:hypothetical protein FRB97_001380 [Tulasnella sp. 331]KAG8886321.1 hypothetical protein FRB98_001306 [Tulasnella sp. 332]
MGKPRKPIVMNGGGDENQTKSGQADVDHELDASDDVDGNEEEDGEDGEGMEGDDAGFESIKRMTSGIYADDDDDAPRQTPGIFTHGKRLAA